MKKIIALAFVSLFVFGIVKADISEEAFKQEILAPFREYRRVAPNIKVPSVIESEFNVADLGRLEFAVYNSTDKTYVHNLFVSDSLQEKIPFSVYESGKLISELSDGKRDTSYQFDVTQDGGDYVKLEIRGSKPITASGLTLELAENVSLPNTFLINALVGGKEAFVRSGNVMVNPVTLFPETTASVWTIELEYSQLLRITDIRFIESTKNKIPYHALRFLAYPEKEYVIYFNPDRATNIPVVGERPNLYSDDNILYVATKDNGSNSLYVKADFDKDGIIDELDNCVYIENEDQKDDDDNMRGDACDDFDRDGVANAKDNCAQITNANQKDSDDDDIGDVCDDREDRLTERLPWLPWIAAGIVFIVIIGLFALSFGTMIRKKEESQDIKKDDENTGNPSV